MGSHRPSLAVCLSSLLAALQQVAVYRCVCVFCVCVNDGPVKAPITRLGKDIHLLTQCKLGALLNAM